MRPRPTSGRAAVGARAPRRRAAATPGGTRAPVATNVTCGARRRPARRARVEQAGDADERVLRRLVAVGRREVRRPLDVRAVVGAARGHAHEVDAEQVEQRRAARVEAERRRRSASGSPTPSAPGAVGDDVEHGQPHADGEPGRRRSHALDGGAQRSCGREVAASGARRRPRAARGQVAVARLHVDEVEAGLLREQRPRRRSRRRARRARRRTRTGAGAARRRAAARARPGRGVDATSGRSG